MPSNLQKNKYYYHCTSCGASFWLEEVPAQPAFTSKLFPVFKKNPNSNSQGNTTGHLGPAIKKEKPSGPSCPECKSTETVNVPVCID